MTWDEEELRRLTELVRKALGDRANKPFKPCIVYHHDLDRVEVFIRDCSYVCVSVVMNNFDLFRDNYPELREEPDAIPEVGFAIEPARRMCKHFGLPTEKVNVHRLLDIIERECPEAKDQVLLARQLLGQVDTNMIEEFGD